MYTNQLQKEAANGKAIHYIIMVDQPIKDFGVTVFDINNQYIFHFRAINAGW